jgi:hypothetical protein
MESSFSTWKFAIGFLMVLFCIVLFIFGGCSLTAGIVGADYPLTFTGSVMTGVVLIVLSAIIYSSGVFLLRH